MKTPESLTPTPAQQPSDQPESRAGSDSPPSDCSTFLSWSHSAGYSTCTSDIQLALEEAWNAGIAEKNRECVSLRHTITLLEKELVGMEMELDCSCNAEELRQARDSNARLQEGYNALLACAIKLRGCMDVSAPMLTSDQIKAMRDFEDLSNVKDHGLLPVKEERQ